MEFGKLKSLWKSNQKHGETTKQKITLNQNGFHGNQANSNHNNSNVANGKDTLDEIEPEVTPDGYGLRTPYGTHLNLDFLKYCEDISHGRLSSQPANVRRPRTSSTSKSRHLRTSMNNAPSTESLDSISSDASEHAENTLMETRRRLEAFRSFRTKRKPSDQPNQIKSPTQKNMASPPWSSQGLSSGQMTPTGFSGMLSSINSLPPQQYQHVREQMVAALKRLKELESQVKQIPLLQVQLSVLQQEKRNLVSDMNKMKTKTTATPVVTNDVQQEKENTPPPPPPKRRYKSVAIGDEVPLQNVVCYAIGDKSFSTLIPTKHFVHSSTECHVIDSATIGTQSDDVSTLHNKTTETEVQCSTDMTTTGCDAIKQKTSSLATQANIAKLTNDFSAQFHSVCVNRSCNTDAVSTIETGVLCKSETSSVSMNTDPILKAEMCSQGTETIHISSHDKHTETLPVQAPMLTEACVGNHIEYNTTSCGSDIQISSSLVASQTQTDDVIKPTLIDACTGNHVDLVTIATGNHADYVSVAIGNHKDTVSIATGEHIEHVSIATSATVSTQDVCVGENVVTAETHTQSDHNSPQMCSVSVGVTPESANVFCETDRLEVKDNQVQCKPNVASVFTEPCHIICSEVSTATDDNELGGKWSIHKQTHEVGSNAVVDHSSMQTNTQTITTCESSSQNIIQTNDLSTSAKPDTADASTEPCDVIMKSHPGKTIPLPSTEAGDYLTIEKYSAPAIKQLQRKECVSVATDTCDLSTQQPTNEIEEYVEKVNSLLEEQQTLLASNFEGFNEENSEKTNTVCDVNNDPPIKSIMRRPGSFSLEKKQLRFAEGVKSDDDDSDSCSCSEEESSSCSECDEESSTVDEDSEAEEDEVIVTSTTEDKIEDQSTMASDESQKLNNVEVRELEEEEVKPEVVKTSCITDSFLDACDVVDSHMKNPWAVSKLDVEEAITFLGNKWMAVAAQKESSDYHVEEFVDRLAQTSRNLLMKVVNLTDDSGNTALHFAISHENFAVVSTLLDVEELRVNKFNQAGFTASMLAALTSATSPNHIAILKKLFKRADVNSHAKQAGQTALMLAVSHGRVECSEALLEAGAEVNSQDVEGSTALMCAAEHGYTDIVKLLIAQPGCDTTITDHDGSTALNIAMERENRDIAILLYAQMNFSKTKFNSKPLSPRNTDHRQPLLSNKPSNSLKS